jgi:phosphoribosylanthranilate isomerase
MVRVKICGNRSLEDALLAVGYGADALGFLVGLRRQSPDSIDEGLAAEIIAALPPFVSSVLVTQLESPDEVVPLAQRLGANTIQLHGDTTPEQALVIKHQLPSVKICKGIHVTGDESVKLAQTYAPAVDAVLLDTVSHETGQSGGTGKTHDWSISRLIVEALEIPVILAGGLTPENVAEAIGVVRPYAVDVNSGTKGADGHKDAARVREFIKEAHSYEQPKG